MEAKLEFAMNKREPFSLKPSTLREAAKHPLASGNAPSPLFWFTSSPEFVQSQEATKEGKKTNVPLFIAKPKTIFKKMWASPVEDRGLSLIE